MLIKNLHVLVIFSDESLSVSLLEYSFQVLFILPSPLNLCIKSLFFKHLSNIIATIFFVLGCSGLYDPCEKGAVDAALALTAQERADLTLTAQVITSCVHVPLHVHVSLHYMYHYMYMYHYKYTAQ